MEIDRILRIQTRLELRKSTSTTLFMAMIEDVGADEFAISLLFGGPESEILVPDETVVCSLTDHEGQAQYGFDCRVLRRESKEVPLYFLSKPNQVVRVQRRGFVRVQVLLSADYRPEGEREWTRASLIDLSGGGGKISHYKALNPGQSISLAFKMHPDDASLFLQGQIVRSIPVITSTGTTYHSGVQFRGISVSVQDRIIAFVFARLLETRRTWEGRV